MKRIGLVHHENVRSEVEAQVEVCGKGKTSATSPRTFLEVPFGHQGLAWTSLATGLLILSSDGHEVGIKTSAYSHGNLMIFGQVYSHTSCGDHDEGLNSKWISPMWRLVVR